MDKIFQIVQLWKSFPLKCLPYVDISFDQMLICVYYLVGTPRNEDTFVYQSCIKYEVEFKDIGITPEKFLSHLAIWTAELKTGGYKLAKTGDIVWYKDYLLL